MNNPPVILFTYKRPLLLQQVLQAIKMQSARVPMVIAYSDGPSKPSECNAVAEVRQILANEHDLPLHIVNRKTNMGCAPNIISGISSVLAEHESAVIIEEDVLPSRFFYESMCDMLAHYQMTEKVFAVGGYPSILPNSLPGYPYDVIMSPRFSCWGWGTWKNRWQLIQEYAFGPDPIFNNAHDVPLHAGADLRKAALKVKENPGCYWDYPIALYCLRKGWLHAISKYYLINNIGIGAGVHGGGPRTERFVNFTKTNNPFASAIPSSFPEAELTTEVCMAIRDYMEALNWNCSPGIMTNKQNLRRIWEIFCRFVNNLKQR